MTGPRTVRDLLEARLGVRTTAFENRAASSIGTTAGQVFRQDPSRVSFLFVNLSLNNITIRPRIAPTSTRGIRLAPNGGSVEVDWETDGEVVAWEWLGIADGAGSEFFALENIIAKET